MVVFWILITLFVALIVIVPLVERFGPRMSDQSVSKLSRYILPLVALLLVIQLLRTVL